jgi:uncharacterized protein YukE
LTDPEAQLRVLASAVAELESYLLSPEVFWRMSGPGELPSLTLGGLELARQAVAAMARSLKPPAREQAEQVFGQLDGIRSQWRTAWQRKAAAELKVRVNQWKAYLQDLADAVRESDSYSQEVRNRAMAAYLLEEAADQPETAEIRRSLELLDARLRVRFEPGPFVWERSLEVAYPAKEFWFLYGRPKA